MKPQVPEGAKIYIKHHRYTEENGEGILLPSKDIRESNLTFLSKGGLTEVFVTLANGTEAAGYAICSDKDNFNRSIGRNIALGRALKGLGL